MSGQKETLYFNENQTVVEVARGNQGVALVNISNDKQQIKLPTTLKNGTYYDVVYNTKFVVKNNILTGILKPFTTYILVKK